MESTLAVAATAAATAPATNDRLHDLSHPDLGEQQRRCVRQKLQKFIRHNYSQITCRLARTTSITASCLGFPAARHAADEDLSSQETLSQASIDTRQQPLRHMQQQQQQEQQQHIGDLDLNQEVAMPQLDSRSFAGAMQYLMLKDQEIEAGGGGTGSASVWMSRPLCSALPTQPNVISSGICNTSSLNQGSPVVTKQLISDNYDTEAKGQNFISLFPSVRGRYAVLYNHGAVHCRKSLSSLGFTEISKEEIQHCKLLDEIILLHCNGEGADRFRNKQLGFVIVNRVMHRSLITNKCSLQKLVHNFETNYPKLVPHHLEADSFIPEGIHLNTSHFCEIVDLLQRHQMLLIKPGHADSGKGIKLFRSNGQAQKLGEFLEKHYPNYKFRDTVLQRYIEQPLLLGGKKFDLRVFLLVVPNFRVGGVYAFFHPGYVRLACREYQRNSDEPTLHLTNQAVQIRDKSYRKVKEATVWSAAQLDEFLNTNQLPPCRDWARRRMYPRIRAILSYIIAIVSSTLSQHKMSYELFGCDFLIDANFNLWLLEVNSDPCLSKTTKVLQQVITQVTEEAMAIAVEVLQRVHRNLPVKQLVTQQDFRKIFSHGNNSVAFRVFAEAGLLHPAFQQQQ